MSDNDILRMRPADFAEATERLDNLAGRFDSLMQAEAANLAVGTTAGDEVSQRVASTLNEVRTAFTSATDEGIAELRDIAATLRSHANVVQAADEGFEL